MRIAYPFAALPNQVCRGGHGAINIAVLAVLLSHGRTWASAATMAREIGCSRTSVFNAIKYWIENGTEYGIRIKAEGRGTSSGETTVYEVDIERMEEPVQLVDTPVHIVNTPRSHSEHKEEPVRKIPQEDPMAGAFDKFWKAYPNKKGKTPARRHYASVFKRNKDLNPQTLLDAIELHKKQEQWLKDGGKFIPHPSSWLNQERWNDEIDLEKEKAVVESKKKAFIDGDQAYQKNGKWYVITWSGQHCLYEGSMDKLEWR